MDTEIKKVRFFDPGKSFATIKDEVMPEIVRVLDNGDLILREDGEKFEQTLAKYVGTKYAVACNSGTDALYMILLALGIKRADIVLVPSHTFVATAQVVNQLGATPILYDRGADLHELNSKYHPKAIMVAHIAGEFMCDMYNLPNVPIIEDACQALGANQNGKKAGSFGVAGAFSFYPAKILGCYGDGGAIVTDDENLYKECIEYRNHYKKDYSKWGINSRLDNLQACVLNVKIKYLDQILEKRRIVAEFYLEKLKDIVQLKLPLNTKGRVWQDFCIDAGFRRDALYDYMKANGVEVMKNDYPFPIPKGVRALKYEAESLRIPCNENLTDSEVVRIVNVIKEFYETQVL